MVSGKATAEVNGTVIAEATEWEEVEGNVYFPPASVKQEYLHKSDLKTTCGWKGVASYYTIKVNGTERPNAAWYYPEPKEAAANIKDHVAFYTSKVNVSKETA
ncbi:e8306269-8795-4afa-b86d-95f84eae4c5e [Thermothielavioides terrestris]|uniref:E8306269-8795-4afa-b86d-95f84eae4c5e n=1 Tax=Thermothielavioides terrestris TaxID=2587410 RepID=A0A3S4BH51_9PEZI|nr:e8306269-8795-4afa-b86d-95f84eae4c5e [Thermothielavioides terrestris]